MEAKSYKGGQYARDITSLNEGDLIVVTLDQLDMIHGEFLGIKEKFGITWFGIKQFGSKYVASAWYKMDWVITWPSSI